MTHVAFFVWMAVQGAPAATLYTIEAFGPADGNVNIVTDLNNRGQVVGDTFNRLGSGPPFIYGNGVFSLEWPSAGRFWAINDQGTAVGAVSVPGGSRAVIHSNGVTSFLPGVPGTSSSAQDINNAGDIVGWAVTVSGMPSRPFVYRGGVFMDLGPLLTGPFGTSEGIADAINIHGQIAGTAGTTGMFTGQLFLTSNGIPMPMGVDAYIAYTSLNDAGNLSFQCGAWFGGPILSEQELGFCPQDLNNRGEVVGWNRQNNISWLWSNGVATRLDGQLVNGGGWTLLRAAAINDLGQIAGRGILNGEEKGFLMTPLEQAADPIPEPGSLTLVCAGFAGLCVFRLRRKAGR